MNHFENPEIRNIYIAYGPHSNSEEGLEER